MQRIGPVSPWFTRYRGAYFTEKSSFRLSTKDARGAVTGSRNRLHPAATSGCCVSVRLKERYLVLWQSCQGGNDGSQRNLALFSQVGGAGEGVGGAAHEPGTGVACEHRRRTGRSAVGPSTSGTVNTVLEVSGGLTLVLNGEVGGDQRWNLTSDVCAVDLPPVLGPVVLDHLGLPNTPALR